MAKFIRRYSGGTGGRPVEEVPHHLSDNRHCTGKVRRSGRIDSYGHSDYGTDEHKQYPGVVTWISDTSEFTPKTILTKNERANLVYAVKIAVHNDGLLKIGMYGGVEFSD